MVNNERTLKTNKTAISAFCSWLQEVHKLESPPEDLDREKFIKLLSEFVLVVGIRMFLQQTKLCTCSTCFLQQSCTNLLHSILQNECRMLPECVTLRYHI